jgi:hypothetical protein
MGFEKNDLPGSSPNCATIVSFQVIPTIVVAKCLKFLDEFV